MAWERLVQLSFFLMLATWKSTTQTINTDFFAHTMLSYYWTSSTYAVNTSYAWLLDFNQGDVVNGFNKSNSYYVRAVRGEQEVGTLIDNGDGTISDRATGLMWQKAEAGAMNWESALTYCESLQLAGHSDWRLPNRNELQSIVDYTRNNLTIDRNSFPGAVAGLYWSSTTIAFNTGFGWVADFKDGNIGDGFSSVSRGKSLS